MPSAVDRPARRSGVELGRSAAARASGTSTAEHDVRASFRHGPGRGRAPYRSAPVDERRAAESGVPVEPRPVSDVRARPRPRPRRRRAGPATWSPPTGCTRRCAECSAWTSRPVRARRFGQRAHLAVAPWSRLRRGALVHPGRGLRHPGGARSGRGGSAESTGEPPSPSCSRRSRPCAASPGRPRAHPGPRGRAAATDDQCTVCQGGSCWPATRPGTSTHSPERASRSGSPRPVRRWRRSWPGSRGATSASWRRVTRRHDLLTQGLLSADQQPATCGATSCRPPPRCPACSTPRSTSCARPA